MSQTINNPLVAAQISILKSMVTSFRAAGDQLGLGLQAKTAFTTLDAIVGEVEALAILGQENKIDTTLITGNKLSRETMEKLFGGEALEARVESLQQTVGQTCQSLAEVAYEYLRDLREKSGGNNDDPDLAGADEVLAMANAAIASSVAEQAPVFGKVAEMTVASLVAPRMVEIADALKNFKS